MLYVISGYILSVFVVHVLLFLRSNNISKIVMMYSAISCLSVAMLLLAFYFKDMNFIDVIFFYIIMSPIGFYGIFLYYKFRNNNNNESKKSALDTNDKNV